MVYLRGKINKRFCCIGDAAVPSGKLRYRNFGGTACSALKECVSRSKSSWSAFDGARLTR